METRKRLNFEFGEEEFGQRLDVVLAKHLPGYSRSFIQRLIRDGRVESEGRLLLSPKKCIDRGIRLHVDLPEHTMEKVEAEDFAFPILFEDEEMLVINKPPGVVVHPAAGNYSGTVVNALLGRYPHMNEQLENMENRPGIVHRLDKDTSGCLIIAKTPSAHFKLARSFAQRETEKFYLAIACGLPSPPSGRIETLIGRHPVNRKKMAVVKRNGKEAVSCYRSIASAVIDKIPISLLEVQILTGRTHQIRVHLNHIKTPVLGDTLYGGDRSDIAADRQMLHAWKIAIPHPVSKEMLHFTAPEPEDFMVLEKLIRQNA